MDPTPHTQSVSPAPAPTSPAQAPTAAIRVRHLQVSRVASVATLLAAGSLVAWSSWRAQPTENTQVPATPPQTVQARTPADLNNALQLVATVRWGRPGARPAPRVTGGVTQPWDGYLALDCGEITAVDSLGFETAGDAQQQDKTGDRLGPVVIGDAGDQRVYWRSATAGDWDGVRVRLKACRPAPQQRGALRIVTPHQSWMAPLESVEDQFVSLPVDAAGQVLEVHITAERDAAVLPRTRLTGNPRVVQPGNELAETPEP